MNYIPLLKNLRMSITTMFVRILITIIERLTRHAMGFHNLIAKLGQSVTKMLDHNSKRIKAGIREISTVVMWDGDYGRGNCADDLYVDERIYNHGYLL